MNEAVIPLVAHKLNNLEPLCKVERLLCGGNVDSLIKIIFTLTVNRSGNITGGIESGAIALQNKADGHIPLFKINDRRAIIDLKKSFVTKKLYLRGHLVGIEGLTLV